jgi:hypothetical protein
MSAVKAMVLAVGLLLAATPASAVNGLQFLEVFDNKGPVEEMNLLTPIVRRFIKEGYHDVPDWAVLGAAMRVLILKRGYRDKDIAEIALEAAISMGMSK